MAYFIQHYNKGYIQREGDKYEYNVNGEVVGIYPSIEELVDANPIEDGKQASESKPGTSEATADDVAGDSDQKTTTKKSTKKSA